MTTLVFLEHRDGAVTKGSLGVLAKARELGDAAGVVIGSGARALAESVGGVVFIADDPRLDAPLPQPRVDVLATLVREGEVRRGAVRAVGARGGRGGRAGGAARRGTELGPRRPGCAGRRARREADRARRLGRRRRGLDIVACARRLSHRRLRCRRARRKRRGARGHGRARAALRVDGARRRPRRSRRRGRRSRTPT